MHDPQTLAFSIKSPFKNKHGYRSALIDIWHCDPENFRWPDGEGKWGGRNDDSCGWYAPMYRESEWNVMKGLAKQQYRELFARQVASAKGVDYAYVCNHPETTYETLYWVWRSIKAYGKNGWQYGNKKNFLSPSELEFIMQLASNPVDNFKNHVIKDECAFVEMFRMIWNQYRRFHRPWYKHPRWHVHHWSIQFHPWQRFSQKYLRKCDRCGKRGSKSWYNTWSGGKKDAWCETCNGGGTIACGTLAGS